MFKKHPILVGATAGLFIGLLPYPMVLYVLPHASWCEGVFKVVYWLPSVFADWITANVIGGPVEVGFWVFVPLALLFWLLLGLAVGLLTQIAFQKGGRSHENCAA